MATLEFKFELKRKAPNAKIQIKVVVCFCFVCSILKLDNFISA
jgi:hypothetical protein